MDPGTCFSIFRFFLNSIDGGVYFVSAFQRGHAFHFRLIILIVGGVYFVSAFQRGAAAPRRAEPRGPALYRPRWAVRPLKGVG